MKWTVLHRSNGRIRVHAEQERMTPEQADILEYYLLRVPDVTTVHVHERTRDAVIRFCGSETVVRNALARFSYEGNEALLPERTARALNRRYEEQLVGTVILRAVNRLFFPLPLQTAIACCKSAGFILKALKVLAKGRFEVEILDATAIVSSLAMGDTATASSIMFLLKIGEILEEWTYKKSVNDLARTMSLNVDRVWSVAEDGGEMLVSVRDVKPGDLICVHTGNLIPLDGFVTDGEAMVEQASITGEPMPVRKCAGAYVYAGTAVEEGDLTVRVEKGSGTGRYDRIVAMIEESEQLKSETEAGATMLADRLVPFSFGGMALTFLLTRDINKALSFIMVDFSCALKLAMPLAVLSAMREAGTRRISVKGGKYLEAVAEAGTIVFDKTGTLTMARPSVADVIAFGNEDPQEMLRLAACLEEHYPHSMANAVVEEAKKRGLDHAEKHTKVEYVVAHGIASSIDGKRVIIGSRHFVFEDEGVRVPEDDAVRFEALPDTCSHLYLAIGGMLSAVILIDDPVREEAAGIVRKLHDAGIERVVMMTGDNRKTAEAVARKIGADACYAEVLPEDKALFIRKEHEAGRKVIMVGDGVNDSPALSEADAGIAISAGAAIAREVADITVSENDLTTLLILRELSVRLTARIRRNYRFIMTFNAALIALGFTGILPNATSALLHNASTVGIALSSMTALLPEMPDDPA